MLGINYSENKSKNINTLSKTILENTIIKSISSNSNKEKIILSNLSSRIWETKDLSKALHKFKDNEISNKHLEFKEMESEFLQIKKFIIPKKENFEK